LFGVIAGNFSRTGLGDDEQVWAALKQGGREVPDPFSHVDVGVAQQDNHAGVRATQQQRGPKINFREIFRVVRFSTFATISATT
jgi:hypothetical protein